MFTMKQHETAARAMNSRQVQRGQLGVHLGEGGAVDRPPVREEDLEPLQVVVDRLDQREERQQHRQVGP